MHEMFLIFIENDVFENNEFENKIIETKMDFFKSAYQSHLSLFCHQICGIYTLL